ncbi:hypothetical protein DUI87_28671 [Hirundo rustica rustica]|uniref:Uncharacterized protein n=1 Tax=Hirundo rustica rustica TaxID=333673 RepID=A0A3M0J1E2_HIRRU|nr:hypothetical protein DUI87_28671 [Hirundo rustica rustica]
MLMNLSADQRLTAIFQRSHLNAAASVSKFSVQPLSVPPLISPPGRHPKVPVRVPIEGPIDTNKANSEQNTVTKGAADSRLEEEEKVASPTKDSSVSCDQITDKTSKAYRM